jgi:hypothetical protein
VAFWTRRQKDSSKQKPLATATKHSRKLSKEALLFKEGSFEERRIGSLKVGESLDKEDH